VRGRHLGPDLGVVLDGLRIAHEFGFGSLEEMARVAWFLERSVYEPESLREAPGGVRFALRNPPLRMGAFQAIDLFWDGRLLPRTQCSVRPGDSSSARPFDSVTRAAPVTLAPGCRVEFFAEIGAPGPGAHTLKLELRSLAIPPTVWFQVSDHVRPAGTGHE
jgi:hypothetical protein